MKKLITGPWKLMWGFIGAIVIIAFAIAIGAYIALIAGLIGMIMYIVKYVQQKNAPVKTKPTINGQVVSRTQTRSAQRRAGKGNGKGKLSPVYKQWWFYCLVFALVIFAWTGFSS